MVSALKSMPRLIGKTSKAPSYLLVTLLVAAAVTGLEYIGAIDIVPGFGRDNPIDRPGDGYPRSPRLTLP